MKNIDNQARIKFQSNETELLINILKSIPSRHKYLQLKPIIYNHPNDPFIYSTLNFQLPFKTT